MNGAFHNIDPRVLLALSGEFKAPCDPVVERLHTLAFLLMATLEKGTEIDSSVRSADSNLRYLPSWAPIAVGVRVGASSNKASSYTIANLAQPLSTMRVYLDAYPYWSSPSVTTNRGVLLASNSYAIDTVEGCARAKDRTTRDAQSYFACFDGWTKDEEGVWVPPTAPVS